MNFVDNFLSTDKGVAFLVKDGIFYFVYTTPGDYRFYMIEGNHRYKMRKVYDEDGIIAYIENNELGGLDWTYV